MFHTVSALALWKEVQSPMLKTKYISKVFDPVSPRMNKVADKDEAKVDTGGSVLLLKGSVHVLSW